MNLNQKKQILSRTLYVDPDTLLDEKINERFSLLTREQYLDEFYTDDLKVNEVKPR